MPYEYIAGVLIAGILSGGAVITASIVGAIRFWSPKTTNGLSRKVSELSERMGTSFQKHAETKAHYGDIMRRLGTMENKMDELLKRE